MTTTSAADLLDRADRLTQTLRDAHPHVTVAQWETFDVTFHRLLHELVGTDAHHIPHREPQRATLKAADRAYPCPLRPPADEYLSPAQAARLTGIPLRTMYREIHRGHLHTIRQGQQLYIPTPPLDTRPDITPADPLDTHPLARLSVTLGVLADLLHDTHTHDTPFLTQRGETTHVTTHLIALGMVAASTALDTMPHRDADRPLLIAQYTEHVLDALGRPENPTPPQDLHYLVADTPTRTDTPSGRLHDALLAWHQALEDGLREAVPNSDMLRTLAHQSAHLTAVTIGLRRAAEPERTGDPVDSALRTALTSLRGAGDQWKGLTTLNRPSHAFITASRDLTAALKRTTTELPTLTADDLADTLAPARHGLDQTSALLDQTRTLPDRLVRSGLVFAPARRAAHNLDHLAAQNRGGYVPAVLCDAPDLDPTWQLATSSLDWATTAWRHTAPSTGPEREAPVIDLAVRQGI